MLRVAVLCSHRAPGVLHLLNRDDHRGRRYDVVCTMSTEYAFAEEVRIERRGVPTRGHSIRDFYGRHGAPLYRDFAARAAFDLETVHRLQPYAPDLILLTGYTYLVTEVLLDAYPNRVINLHFSDLTLRLGDGRPRFPGLRAVRDALAVGQPETFATVHLVDDRPDAGAPIVRSWGFAAAPLVRDARIWNALDMFKAYAFAHEQWMMRAASGPLLAAALQLVATGAVDLDALGASDPACVVPWRLDERGALRAPQGTDHELHPHAA